MTTSYVTHLMLIGMITHSEVKLWYGYFMFYQRLLKLGKYHFCIMSERTLRYRTDNVRSKCSKSRKWEKGSAEMHVCVGWYVKWSSLWRYTTLPSYNFIEWMISMIVTVRLWRHSKYRMNQTGSIYDRDLTDNLKLETAIK